MSDTLEELEMREIILLQEIECKQAELKLIRMRMSLVRRDVKRSSELNKESTSLGCETAAKMLASPEQTASGKGTANSLNPDALDKSMSVVQTAVNFESSSSLNLRPKGGIQIPQKSAEQSVVCPVKNRPSKAYYVVFNGPYAGIYTSLSVAEQAISGISGAKLKKFRDLDEAVAAGKIYTEKEFKPPLKMVYDDAAIAPYKKALKKEVTSQQVIGKKKLSQASEIWLEDDDEEVHIQAECTWEDFWYIYSMARRATQQQFVDEHYFTTDKNNVSYINCYPGADSGMVYEAFIFGLLGMVYPSDNLQEIQGFPARFRNAVKQFKKKCLKGKKEIFIKFQSTIFTWEECDEFVNGIGPVHYVQIGAIKEKVYSPSQEVPAKLERADLLTIAEQKLMDIIIKVFSIKENEKMSVNLATNNLLLTSFSNKEMSSEDKQRLSLFKERIVRPFALGSHKESFCHRKKKELAKLQVPYSCKICQHVPTEASGIANGASGSKSSNNAEDLVVQ